MDAAAEAEVKRADEIAFKSKIRDPRRLAIRLQRGMGITKTKANEIAKQILEVDPARQVQAHQNRSTGGVGTTFKQGSSLGSTAQADLIDMTSFNSKTGSHVLIMVDVVSRKAQGRILPNNLGSAIRDALSGMELPAILDTDRGSEWMNDVVQRFLEEKNVAHHSRACSRPIILRSWVERSLNGRRTCVAAWQRTRTQTGRSTGKRASTR